MPASASWVPREPIGLGLGGGPSPLLGGVRGLQIAPPLPIPSGQMALPTITKGGMGVGGKGCPAPPPPKREACPFLPRTYCKVWRAILHSGTCPHSSLLLQGTPPPSSLLSCISPSKQTSETHLVGGETEAPYPASCGRQRVCALSLHLPRCRGHRQNNFRGL